MITAAPKPKKINPSGVEQPKKPEVPKLPEEDFISPVKPVKSRPSGRVPSNNKSMPDPNEYTIDKNPEFNMHNPKFAEDIPTLPS